MGNLANFILSLIEISLAMMMFHRAVPTELLKGRAKAFKTWFLALALGMFGVDRLTAFIAVQPTPFITMLAHCWLATYGILRFGHIARFGLSKWGVKDAVQTDR